MGAWRRTHTCGELREAHIGQTVVLNGWVNTARDHNLFVFVDLRDRYGMTQVVFEPDRPELLDAARELRSEWVIAVKGQVAHRTSSIPFSYLSARGEPIGYSIDLCKLLVEAIGDEVGRELAIKWQPVTSESRIASITLLSTP